MSDATYTLVFSTRELSWKICEYSADEPFRFRTGHATISEENLDVVRAALHELRRAKEVQCGADKAREQIVFSIPEGDITYVDDFYFCDPADTTAYVSGLGKVIQELHELTQ